jgi:hypothetical protein
LSCPAGNKSPLIFPTSLTPKALANA